MTDELTTILDDLHSKGYDTITPTEGMNHPEASGTVLLPEEHRRNAETGWRRFLPLVHCGDDPDFVPEEVRSVVATHGWTVQPMGRDDETVLVVIAERGV